MAHTPARTTQNSAQPAPHPAITAATLPAAEREDAANNAPTVKLRGAPIPQSAMQDAAYARNWWRVVIDVERTPYDSVLNDVAVWGPNEAKLRAGDLVELLDEQSTLFALLYLAEHVPAK